MSHQHIDGIDLAYESIPATVNGSPLLFIHGSFVEQHAWQNQVAHFSAHHRVITCDLRGHGQSGKTAAPYSVSLFAQDLVSLLDALQTGPAVVCGHSLGGMVAQEMALAAPDRVRALVLAESGYGTGPSVPEALLGGLSRLVIGLSSVESVARMAAQRYGKFSPEAARYLEEQMRAHAADKANYRNIWRAIFNYSSMARLGQITCPTLLVVGEHNAQSHAPAQEMQRRMPNARLEVIPGAGHLVMADNQEAFNQAVARFLHTLSGVPA